MSGKLATVTARSAVRWAATHGALRLAVRSRARRGNPDAVILLDPAVRDDPYGHDERLNRRPFVGGAFAHTSVHHDVCTAVLRSDDFGVVASSRVDGLPPVLHRALRLGGPQTGVGPLDPPSMLDDLGRHGRATGGRVDPVERSASRLPVTVISEVLGVPTDMRLGPTSTTVGGPGEGAVRRAR